jgi:hypothetical protein
MYQNLKECGKIDRAFSILATEMSKIIVHHMLGKKRKAHPILYPK